MLEKLASDPTLALISLTLLLFVVREMASMIKDNLKGKDNSVATALSEIRSKLEILLDARHEHDRGLDESRLRVARLEQDVAGLKAELISQIEIIRKRDHEALNNLTTVLGRALVIVEKHTKIE